jgi:hypothetical protein
MKKSSLFSVLIVAALLIPGCHKEKLPDVLPPATLEGKNTIGFKINGQVWIPGGTKRAPFGSQCPGMRVEYGDIRNGGKGSLNISVARVKNGKSGILGIGAMQNSIMDTGQYLHKMFIQYSDGGAYISGSFSGPIYSEGGYFHINKLDTIKKIISGQFAFSLKSNNTGELVHITEGRFDFHYNVCK